MLPYHLVNLIGGPMLVFSIASVVMAHIGCTRRTRWMVSGMAAMLAFNAIAWFTILR